MNYSITYDKVHFTHTLSEKPNKSDFSNHQHSEYELLLILNGKGTFYIEDVSYDFDKNSAIIIPPGKYHVLKILPKTDYDRFLMHFTPDLLPQTVKIDNVIFRNADENIMSLFYKFEKYTNIYPFDVLYTLLLSFLNESLILLTHGTQAVQSQFSSVPDVVKNCISLINRNLDKNLTVDYIAQKLFVSKTYISHIFSSAMNISIMKYIRLKKMYAAKDLLSQGYTVAVVVRLLGYDCYTTFLRNYKLVFNEKPSKIESSISPRKQN